MTIFTNSFQLKEIIGPTIIWFQTQKQLATLNIWVLLKTVLTDLHARNFLHAKIFLRARCLHVRHRARDLLRPGVGCKDAFEMLYVAGAQLVYQIDSALVLKKHLLGINGIYLSNFRSKVLFLG